MKFALTKFSCTAWDKFKSSLFVQSEQERAMLKQLRREEKRQEKQRVNRGDDTSEPEFNPAELRAQR